MDKKVILNLAKSLLIDLSAEELEQIAKSFDKDEEILKLFEKIDTTDCEPMTYIDEEPRDFLREDIVNPQEILKKEDFLQNADTSNEDFVILKHNLGDDE